MIFLKKKEEEEEIIPPPDHIEASEWERFNNDFKKLVLRSMLDNHRTENPTIALENAAGGYVPHSLKSVEGLCFIAEELHCRQEFRVAKRFDEADLIAQNIRFGGVTLQDFPNGTLYFFRHSWDKFK